MNCNPSKSINIFKLESKVSIKSKRLRKQSKFIEQGKIVPINPDYPFNNVDLRRFMG
jgi:hypothetical protein